MILYKTIFFTMLFLIGKECFCQDDTLRHDTRVKYLKQYREKSYKLLLGGNLQQAKKANKMEYTREYLEIGLHKSITSTFGHHPKIVWTQGFSVEIAPENTPVFGFKYGAWMSSFFAFGINGIYYTDFSYGNFKIRPEFGLGSHLFKLTLGYNIPTIRNADFEKIRHADLQITLNFLIKLKTIYRQEW